MIRPPVKASKRCLVSAANGAAPEKQLLMDGKCTLPASTSGWRRRAVNKAGTPATKAGWTRWMVRRRSRMLRGSGMRANGLCPTNATLWPTNMAIGMAEERQEDNIVPVLPDRPEPGVDLQPRSGEPCVPSHRPFGVPVVPPLIRMTAGSSGSMVIWGRGACRCLRAALRTRERQGQVWRRCPAGARVSRCRPRAGAAASSPGCA